MLQRMTMAPQSATGAADDSHEQTSFDIVRSDVWEEITKQVIRCRLAKKRHLVLRQAIAPPYLDSLFPELLKLFDPQTVYYNGGIGKVPEWKISCYLEVMDGGIPTTEPHTRLFTLFEPLLDHLNTIFVHWYQQQHGIRSVMSVERLMTFVTRYTPNPGEQALLKHVDGAGKVDGSVVLAMPIDRSNLDGHHGFEGGGLTFWENRHETHYDTRSGDVALIDRAVWHQADPITKGTRWALVVFYKVER